MRGTILQYNGTDGTGVLVADGQQHSFTISSWKGDTAPAVGNTVDVVLADGNVQAVMLMSDDVLRREKARELTGRVGNVVGGLAKSAVGASILTRYGTPLVIAYAVFFVGSMFFDFVSMQVLGMRQGQPLFDVSSQVAQSGGGSGVKLLVLLAYASIVVPFFVRDRRAWLALILPLLSVAWAFLKIRRAVGPLAELFSYGIGFYITLVAGIYLAAVALKRFRTG